MNVSTAMSRAAAAFDLRSSLQQMLTSGDQVLLEAGTIAKLAGETRSVFSHHHPAFAQLHAARVDAMDARGAFDHGFDMSADAATLRARGGIENAIASITDTIRGH